MLAIVLQKGESLGKSSKTGAFFDLASGEGLQVVAVAISHVP